MLADLPAPGVPSSLLLLLAGEVGLCQLPVVLTGLQGAPPELHAGAAAHFLRSPKVRGRASACLLGTRPLTVPPRRSPSLSLSLRFNLKFNLSAWVAGHLNSNVMHHDLSKDLDAGCRSHCQCPRWPVAVPQLEMLQGEGLLSFVNPQQL